MATVMVTGANRGIGLALCRQLAARGDRVIAACRSASDELKGLDLRVIEGVDVASDQAVARLAEQLDGEGVDVLINNAGILERDGFDELDLDSVRRQIEVNSIGVLRVTHALRETLGTGSKIAIVTSLMGSMGDNGSGRYYGYRMSKAAVNAAGVSLAIDLKPRGIAVAILHPGMVATQMTNGRGIDVEQSASGLIARIDELSLDNSGTFWHQDGRQLPW